MQTLAAWLDLTVDDASALKDFYAGVLGWTVQPVPMNGYDDFTMLSPDGQSAAGVCHRRGPNQQIPPVWMPYFLVADLDAALARVAEKGGKPLVGPREAGTGRYGIVQDPAGAAFALYQAGDSVAS